MLTQQTNLNEKVGIVTGGASGFGKALVELMVKKGVRVVFGDIDIENGRKLESKLNRTGNNVKFISCDVSNESDLINLFETANSEFGGAQIMVNNAGISLYEKFEKSTHCIDSTIDINLKAVLKGTSLAIQHFKQQNCDDYCIINTASISGVLPASPIPIYSVSKAAVIYMTQTLRHLKDQNIRVNAVAPGPSPTPIFSRHKPHPMVTKVIESFGMIPVDEVINAMFNFIEDRTLAGEVRVITVQKDELLPRINHIKL